MTNEEFETFKNAGTTATERLARAAFVTEILGEWATPDDAETGFNDGYVGTFESVEQWAFEYLSDVGALSACAVVGLDNYVDFSAFARDCVADGSIGFATDPFGDVHAFSY